jgi:peptidoglycan/xylan/chitin deacetylase (PgdA/CDA1 family)
MYHYVRDLRRTRYPDIAALQTEAFRGQVDYIQRHFDVISARDLMGAVEEDMSLPDRPALLTFDDGYLDHFTQVFPILDDAGIPAAFFPPAKSILERTVLDVNKVHYILASASQPGEVVARVETLMQKGQHEFDLDPVEQYRSRLAVPGRYDAAETVYVKRLLQRELPHALRRRITDDLFREFVDVDESVLAEELYMTLDQARTLARNGMYIGSHGYDHSWMDHLTPEEQKRDVARSLEFLDAVGTPLNRWMMCYPYGSHNATLRAIVREEGCVVGLATHVDLASLGTDDPLALPRIDTNDLPVEAEAQPNEWTQAVTSSEQTP